MSNSVDGSASLHTKMPQASAGADWTIEVLACDVLLPRGKDIRSDAANRKIESRGPWTQGYRACVDVYMPTGYSAGIFDSSQDREPLLRYETTGLVSLPPDRKGIYASWLHHLDCDLRTTVRLAFISRCHCRVQSGSDDLEPRLHEAFSLDCASRDSSQHHKHRQAAMQVI
nr:hypothetical protein CFP56_10017 [Quercus suber]